MSSNKFLQRFEGKIQVVGKEGVNPVFGNKNQNVVVETNINFNPNPKNRTSNSLTKAKPVEPEPQKEKRNSLKKVTNHVDPPAKKQIKKPSQLPPKEKKSEKQDNPYLVSNPFYLDEDEKHQLEQQRKERELRQKQIEKELQKNAVDAKKATTTSLNKSLEKKKNEKEWVKLGGLGANIGGDEWNQKKKKQQKMQEFASQVKQINKDKPKVPKPERKEDKKESIRQKALEYSKNVPKPVVVRQYLEKVQEPEQKEPEVEKEISELQQYQLRHQQLKNMLRNQI